MEKNNFRKKNWLDIKFSVIAFLGFIPLYLLLGIIIEVIIALNDYSTSPRIPFFMLAIPLGIVLGLSLFINIFIQLLLNKASEGNKIKSYLFFVTLNIDMLFSGFGFFGGGIHISNFFNFTIILVLFFIIPILIKYLITRYYYKKLQKITFNEKINH